MMSRLLSARNTITNWARKFVALLNQVFAPRTARAVLYCSLSIVLVAIMVEQDVLTGDTGQILGNALGIVAAVLASLWIAELNQKQNAKVVAAPIRAELLIYHELAIKNWRENLSTVKELDETNDPTVGFHFIHLPKAQKSAFENLRGRLGELGAFLSQEITNLYTFLPVGGEDRDCKLKMGKSFCETQRQDLQKIERVIDLLFALERTGQTEYEALTEEVKSQPAQLSDRTGYPKKG